MMVTASHQAPEKNGFKLLAQGGGLTSAQVEEILVAAQKTVLPQRLVTERDALSPYQERLAQMARERLDDFVQCPLLGMHVIVDAGNGSGGFYARFLEELGVETTGSRCLEPNGHFPDHLPNPESREALTALATIVRE
ncbi:MAG: phosphomannomutase/phosphoglucomutase, partial [Clostridia bacterium]|nr:phosphomannomutase/phosphoglucomutase [Clostridia bacterium]